jgi:hypothetical protein
MASEILPVPEECLGEVIRIIRAGLKAVTIIPDQDKPKPPFVRQEVIDQLNRWCDDEADYAKRHMSKEYRP